MGYSFLLTLFYGSNIKLDKFDLDVLGNSNENNSDRNKLLHFISRGGCKGGSSLLPIQIYTSLSYGKYLYECDYHGEDDTKVFKYDAEGLDYCSIKDKINEIIETKIEQEGYEVVIIYNYIDNGKYSGEKVFQNTHVFINKKYIKNLSIKQVQENTDFPEIYPHDFY